MQKESNGFDHFLLRSKDIIFIVVAVWGFLVWSGSWSTFPERLEASEKEIRQAKSWEQRTDTRLAVMEQDIKYIVKSIDEIKEQKKRG